MKVASDLNTEINNQNLVYCSTFQLAWNELSDYLKGQITFSKENPDVDELNLKSFTKKDLKSDCYVSIAGFVKDKIVEKIQTELKTKFKETTKIDFSGLSPDDIIAYAFLLKILEFSVPFEKMEDLLFDSKEVKAFGIKVRRDSNGKMRNQVRILDYKSDDDFTITLKSKSGEYICLSKCVQPETLKVKLDSINFQVRHQVLNDGEILRIPNMFFDIEHHFKNFIGQNLLVDKKDIGYYIIDAVQLIKFELNEEGAKLRSEAAMMCRKCISTHEPKPRKFVFDKPFFICLKEDLDKPPYFVAWIKDSKLLVGA